MTARALTQGERYDGDTETFIAAFNWQGDTNQGADLGMTDRPNLTGSSTWAIAAPLSHGSNPNSNAAGRRREDDVNLVAQTGLQGIIRYARASEADARTLLRNLRNALGTEAATEWGSGVSDPLQQAEVLWPLLHGRSVQGEAEEDRPWVDDRALSRAADEGRRTLRILRCSQIGSPPPRRELAEQLAGELTAALSELPHEDAPQHGVRRLTPLEAERLQGFPDHWTAGRPDSFRYAALGDAVTVPVAKWIGTRLNEYGGAS